MEKIKPVGSVILATRNRKDLLRGAIISSLDQSVPVEVIVLDDDSSDGTEEMVRELFPALHYRKFEGPNGAAFLRNRGAEIASTEFLFSIDDDAAFSSTKTIEQTIAEFSDPRIGAVAIPFINVHQSSQVISIAPDNRQIYLTSAFVGTAQALRRSVFFRAGGYRDELFYMGEEGDLCLRMLNQGFVTRLGNADPIHHYESPIRDSVWAGLYGRRNDILCTWYNVPLTHLPGRMLRTTINGVVFGLKVGRPFRMLQGLLWGYFSVLMRLKQRKPVSEEIFRLFRELVRTPTILNEVEELLDGRVDSSGKASGEIEVFQMKTEE